MLSIRNYIPLGSLVLGIILELLLHWWMPVARIIPMRITGILIIGLGIFLMVTGVRTILRHKTDIRPGGTPSTLVTSGPYQYTRNPIYLGNVTILLGVAVLLGSLTPFIAIPLYLLIVATIIIPFEERRLAAIFGTDYEHYRQRVRRWL